MDVGTSMNLSLLSVKNYLGTTQACPGPLAREHI